MTTCHTVKNTLRWIFIEGKTHDNNKIELLNFTAVIYDRPTYYTVEKY